MSLDAARIASLLTTRRFGRSLDVRARTGSTNDDAREARSVPDGHVILADAQDAGRGARGRRWSSPAGTDLYFSILLDGAGLTPATMPTLTLAVGLGVAEACEALCGEPLCVKWPNDVVHGAHKLAGVLVESVSVGARLERVIIGVGVDVNRARFDDALAPIATSLARVAGASLDREAAFATLLGAIEREVDRFVAQGAGAIVPRVEARLAWRGRAVACDDVRGDLVGLRADGALRVRSGDGAERALVSGTLRLA
ncbi:MAG: biotin--[acetyl-CoA-carboxylase] ligase [Sandaracinaceae bacterium]|nr:biotin--[acetyl-CoA-carboxylase] ligase [Sandaracinaceae bacterium]